MSTTMIYSSQPDEILVNLALMREDNAYEELVRRWEKLVIGSARRAVNHPQLCEDAAQDAFVSAWLKLDQLRDPSKYGPWVCRIARNRALRLAAKHRTEIGFSDPDNPDRELPPVWMDADGDKGFLRDAVESLAPAIRQTIVLYYYEGYSVAEIAGKLQVPAGTVKWRLSDGRDKLRKDFGIMDEKFVKRVMEKVETLKRWRLQEKKDGFAEEYRDVLADIDKLPESREKYHAMADVLKMGYWWLAEEKNEETLARLREAAEKGHNDEAMETVISLEHDKLSGKAKIEKLRDEQIPYLEREGYVLALGYAWFWLGREYALVGQKAEAQEAFDRVLGVLKPTDVYYATALSAKALEGRFDETANGMYQASVTSEQYRFIDGKWRFWSQPGYWLGGMERRRDEKRADFITYYASRCGRVMFIDGLPLGGVHTDADGHTLTFAGENETVETPAGVFEGCERWVNAVDKKGEWTTWFKPGVGIVKQTSLETCRLLKAYRVSGEGRFPIAAGNHWEYEAVLPDCFRYENIVDLVGADEEVFTLSIRWAVERLYWDENSWEDAAIAMRSGYCKPLDGGNEQLVDVSHYMERMEALADTPRRRAHTKAACSVMRRIFDTDPDFTPDAKAKGHWNFFSYEDVEQKDGRITIDNNRIWGFEWKDMAKTWPNGFPLLANDILGILQDIAGCIWSDEWVPGLDTTFEYKRYSMNVKTHLVIREAGTVTTAAGTFDNCIRAEFDVTGMTGGWGYRGDRKEYTFALGVGIVRMVNHYPKPEADSVYELTEYAGTGEGYMPLGDGFMRRYEALDLKDGYEASSVYTMSEEDGKTVIFGDRAGIHRKS